MSNKGDIRIRGYTIKNVDADPNFSNGDRVIAPNKQRLSASEFVSLARRGGVNIRLGMTFRELASSLRRFRPPTARQVAYLMKQPSTLEELDQRRSVKKLSSEEAIFPIAYQGRNSAVVRVKATYAISESDIGARRFLLAKGFLFYKVRSPQPDGSYMLRAISGRDFAAGLKAIDAKDLVGNEKTFFRSSYMNLITTNPM